MTQGRWVTKTNGSIQKKVGIYVHNILMQNIFQNVLSMAIQDGVLFYPQVFHLSGSNSFDIHNKYLLFGMSISKCMSQNFACPTRVLAVFALGALTLFIFII